MSASASPPPGTRSPTPELSDVLVLARCDFFTTAQLWPLRHKINPELWLSNFMADEREHAIQLLNSFQYFSEDFVDEIFKAAVHTLSSVVTNPNDPFMARQNQWRSFIDGALFTYVTGENPNPTDSGYL